MSRANVERYFEWIFNRYDYLVYISKLYIYWYIINIIKWFLWCKLFIENTEILKLKNLLKNKINI